ncbi:MAG: glutamate-cysteine ligase family protein [Porcipelethomonas sp.]
MTATELYEAIRSKYISPTKRKRKKYVGIEFEFPIVNRNRAAVDFSVVHRLTGAFISNFDFQDVRRDYDGNIYFAQSEKNGDGLSYDCSYNTLELSFGIERDIHILEKRFRDYYDFIEKFLEPFNYTLTGMGTNPYHELNNSVPIPSERYRMLFRHLSSYVKYGDVIPFHHVPDYAMFSCASQVQLDVEEEMLPEAINTFSKLEPLKAVLFANSPWEGRPDYFINRDYFWRYGLHGFNQHNVDGYAAEIHSVDELVYYFASMSMYCVERDGKYINFAPTPLRKYFASEYITGEYYDGKGYQEIKFRPQPSDLEYLRSFKSEDLTYRGTVEFRSVCMQPVGEIMSSAAFHAGLMENLHPLTRLLEQDTVIYQKGYSVGELRDLFSRRELPDFVDRKDLSKLLIRVLNLADDGLRSRGSGEEVYLEPLYFRAEHLLSPAKQLAEELAGGRSLDECIMEYADPDRNISDLRRSGGL